jgi:hypothetical protein
MFAIFVAAQFMPTPAQIPRETFDRPFQYLLYTDLALWTWPPDAHWALARHGVNQYMGQASWFDFNSNGTTDQLDLDCAQTNLGNDCLTGGPGTPCQ